jgi:hypothetical protein
MVEGLETHSVELLVDQEYLFGREIGVHDASRVEHGEQVDDIEHDLDGLEFREQS